MIGKLKSKEEIAKDTLKVVFEANEPFSFKPGQYCFITLSQLKYPDQRGPRRHFSIVNSPNEKGIITFTTRITESGFKKTLKELEVGEEVELGPIAGTFTLPMHNPGLSAQIQTGIGNSNIVFIAGGIGITPFISILRYLKENGNPYNITLIYSNRDRGSTAYLEELQNFKFQISNFKLVLTMTEDPNWTGEKRKIDASFIKEYFPNVNGNHYMVVGPPPMVEAVQKSLQETGVLNENIEIERFTGY